MNNWCHKIGNFINKILETSLKFDSKKIYKEMVLTSSEFRLNFRV